MAPAYRTGGVSLFFPQRLGVDSHFHRYRKVHLVGILSALFLFLCTLPRAPGQTKIVVFDNPSLEGEPGIGDLPGGWYYCGPAEETPPDIHPNGSFGVTHRPADGATYMALVGRPNGTTESIAQRLPHPLSPNHCYRLDLYVSRSPFYVAVDRVSRERLNHNGALKIQVWGGSIRCQMNQLLAESDVIGHTEWREIKLLFKPSASVEHLILKAVHAPVKEGYYPGNILLDRLSPIVIADCRTGAYAFSPDTLQHQPVARLAEGKALAETLGADLRFDPWSNQLLREVYAEAGNPGLHYFNRALHRLSYVLRDLPGQKLLLAVRGESRSLIKDRIRQLKDECERLNIPSGQVVIRKAKKQDAKENWDAQNRFLFLRLD